MTPDFFGWTLASRTTGTAFAKLSKLISPSYHLAGFVCVCVSDFQHTRRKLSKLPNSQGCPKHWAQLGHNSTTEMMTSLTSSMFLLSGLQTRRIMTGADQENKVRPHQTCILETLVVRADSSTGQKCCTSGFHSLHSLHSTRSSHGQLRQLRQLRQLSPQLSPQLSQLVKVRLPALRSTQIQVPYPSGSRSARLRTILGLENPKMNKNVFLPWCHLFVTDKSK